MATVAFGSKAWGANLLQLINYRLDLFLLAAFVAQAGPRSPPGLAHRGVGRASLVNAGRPGTP